MVGLRDLYIFFGGVGWGVGAGKRGEINISGGGRADTLEETMLSPSLLK